MINSELWEEYLFIRKAKQKRNPFTPQAEKRALNKLNKWDAIGYNIDEIMIRTNTAGWLDFYLQEEDVADLNNKRKREPVQNSMVLDLVAKLRPPVGHNYEGMANDELKQIAYDRGIEIPATRTALIERLTGG